MALAVNVTGNLLVLLRRRDALWVTSYKSISGLWQNRLRRAESKQGGWLGRCYVVGQMMEAPIRVHSEVALSSQHGTHCESGY